MQMNRSEQQQCGSAGKRGGLLEPKVDGKPEVRVYFSCFNSTKVRFDLGPWTQDN